MHSANPRNWLNSKSPSLITLYPLTFVHSVIALERGQDVFFVLHKYTDIIIPESPYPKQGSGKLKEKGLVRVK